MGKLSCNWMGANGFKVKTAKYKSDSVNSMVAVVKPNNIRICIDARDFNEAINREHFPMTTIEHTVAVMPVAKVFSVLESVSRYW